MPIYGYDIADDDAPVPCRLAEVTFALSSADLRRVARFLADQAAEIEAGRFVAGGRHLRDFDPDERPGQPLWDVIVVPPTTDGIDRSE